MEYRNLGHSGVKGAEVGLGTDQFGRRVDKDTVKRIVDVTLDSGINFVLIENRSDGAPPALTVFASEDVDTICGWEGDLTKDILLRLSGNQVYCTE